MAAIIPETEHVYFSLPMRHSVRAVGIAAVLYFALTVTITWPLLLHPSRVVPGDLGDPLLNSRLIAWNAQVMPLTERWWNLPQFYPVPGVTAFSEHLLGIAWLTTPIVALGGSPLLAYNGAFLLSFPLCALAAYLLCFAISRRNDAALVAGLAYGFAPYRMSQISHVQVLSAYWMPLSLLGLHLYFRDRRPRWLVLFAGAWLMQALACGYYLFYLSVLVALWLVWFGSGRDRWGDVGRVVASWAAAALLMAPVAYGYWKFQHAYGLRRWPDEIQAFSADVASLFKAPESLRLWGWLDVIDKPESALFPGVTGLALVFSGVFAASAAAAHLRGGRLRTARVLLTGAVIAAAVAATPVLFGPWRLEPFGVRLLSVSAPQKPLSVAMLLAVLALALHPSVRGAWSRRSALAFYTLAMAVMWVMSLGPSPTLLNQPVLYKAPYAWLMLLPGVDGIRVPARFWVLATLCLAVAAGLAVAELTSRSRRWRALPVVACLGILVEGWPHPMLMVVPPDARPSHVRAVARLELPVMPTRDMIPLYRSIDHQVPLINGYSGYFAPHYWALRHLLDRHDPAVLTRLAEFGPIEVVIDHADDADRAWRRYVGAHPHAERVHEEAAYSAYVIQRSPVRAAAAVPRGRSLPVASISASVNSDLGPAAFDGDLISRWHTGSPQAPGNTVIVDLAQPREVDGVALDIAGYVADFPRVLRVETSTDGTAWASAWSGEVAMRAFSAALEHPRTVPLVFTFEPRPARYVRLRQEGSESVYYWSIAELRVLGR